MLPPLLAALATCANVPSASALAHSWNTALAFGTAVFDYHWPPLQEADWREVAAGGVGQRTWSVEGKADRLLAVGWIDQPLVVVWLGLRDEDHQGKIDDLSEANLRGTDAHRRIAYQHLDLPFPISNRHWVIQVRNNAGLFLSSNRQVCERSWGLDPRGLGALDDVEPALRHLFDGAIWTPVNDGGWLLVAMGDATLIAYQLRTDLGGVLPGSLVTSYAKAKMAELIGKVSLRADAVPSHYTGDHAPILFPDGTPIERF